MTDQDTNTNTTPVTPQPPAQPTETQPEKTGDDKRFTQDELERIISERLKRDRESQQKQFYEGLGVNSADELKDMLSDYNKRKEAEMSEAEKLKLQLEKQQAETEKARQEAQAIRDQMIATGRKSVFMDAIRSNGGSDADQLFILVQASLSDELNKVFEDGQTTADDNQLKAFVKTVQTKFPKYFGNAGAGNPSMSGGINPNANSLEEAEKMTRKFRKL